MQRSRKNDSEIKIAIHGTTYCSNFGDVLFARMFYQACTKIPHSKVAFLQIPHFGICDFVRKATGYSDHIGKLEYLRSDVLVLMSGGYLGLDIPDNYHALRNYVRSVLPVRLFQLFTRRPVYIIGLGVGSIDVRWFRKKVVKLVNQARMIIVREEETKRYLQEYGVKKEIMVTADTALSYNIALVEPFTDPVFNRLFSGKKVIFLHINEPNSDDDRRISEKIVPALNDFLRIHHEYGVALGHDYLLNGRIEDTMCWQKLQCEWKYAFKYDGIDGMLSILKRVDMIITPKLHVAVMGCLFEKSVFSFTIDKEKTLAFFKQIGHPERCIRFSDIDYNVVFQQLSEYYDQSVAVPMENIELAKQNLLFVEDLEREFLKDGKKEKNN